MLESMDLSLAASENDKKIKQEEIESLRQQLNHQDEAIAKMNKEKKEQEEQCRKLAEDLEVCANSWATIN